MPKGVFATLTQCKDPSREEEFNRWYCHTHLPDLSKARGFVRAQRFRNINPNTEYRYMAVYEFDSPDLKESTKDLLRLALKAFADGRHIDCIGVSPNAGPPPNSGTWEEIDPKQYKPLEKLDYPRTVVPHVKSGIEAYLRS